MGVRQPVAHQPGWFCGLLELWADALDCIIEDSQRHVSSPTQFDAAGSDDSLGCLALPDRERGEQLIRPRSVSRGCDKRYKGPDATLEGLRSGGRSLSPGF
jgi:hypothetical protein